MINLTDFIELGNITKSHGIGGELVVALKQLIFENIIKMESVMFIANGLPVPFFISHYSEKPPSYLIIKFDDINTEEQARKFMNTRILIHKSYIQLSDKKGLNKIDLLQYKIIDHNHGLLGVLKDISGTKENPLYEITYHGKSVFIPSNADYIKNIDHKNRTIEVNLPDGLLEL